MHADGERPGAGVAVGSDPPAGRHFFSRRGCGRGNRPCATAVSYTHLVGAFEEAKIILDAVDIPELAQRNVAALLEDENRGLVFLRIDESGMMLTLSFHGELIAVRSGEISTLQLNGGDADQRSRCLLYTSESSA